MNGLRVFVPDAGVTPANVPEIFYSRRSDGPYYRWSYEPQLQQWRFLRVPADDLPHLALSGFPLKNLPRALQRSLIEHYVE